ncbi:hypothetical protein ONS95_009541 [Cadophora gregata]|uniref:uncharacterized protein n=1 Tax=Cadophora gregata TaxID=51156 RepID=UPI0026DC2415|nr:uncharacterized protein ONS95_009541 [Cadophora gregata]KAK0124592.1 hypothetical protein ONS95_009541 [Cadophora gregata]KAK0129551.1 hypothetical protein ONS96_000116 [Cadophora gregata f. sp. sojae]
MRSSFALLIALPAAVRAWSLNAYNLGLHGVYPTQNFVSLGQPTPWAQISQWDPRCDQDGGLILLSPRGINVPNPGPVILDPRGNLVWSEGKFGQAMNLQVQRYKEEDFLTFWSGTSHGPHSNGSYYMLDSSYEVAHTITSVGIDMGGDLHEFEITDNGTALFTIYEDKQVDCSDVGHDGLCWIDDCLFQEVDIVTGELLFQWRASDHVPLSHSYKLRHKDGMTKKKAWDFFHLNSVEKDDLGNYLISSRHMRAIYYLDSKGNILWSLGGKHSDFTDLSDGYASNFKWQHHARWRGNNTMSFYDNHAKNVFHPLSEFSRGMLVQFDFENMTVKLLQTYKHPDNVLSISQGSMQVIPESGNVMIGWGNTPAYTEFTADGEVLCNTHFGAPLFFMILDFGWVKSYRTFKSPWVGKPKTPPTIKIYAGQIFASWNGATEVAKWRLESAKSLKATDDEFSVVEEIDKNGFEGVFLRGSWERRFVRVAALDREGEVLGYTEVVDSTFEEYVSISLFQIFVSLCFFLVVGFFVWRYREMLTKQSSKIFALRRQQKSTQQYELLDSRENLDDAV